MRHYTVEEIDAHLDGNTRGLRRWLMARHLARCAACRERRAECEAGRAFLDGVRRDAREHDAVVGAMPATLVVAPSLSRGKGTQET